MKNNIHTINLEDEKEGVGVQDVNKWLEEHRKDMTPLEKIQDKLEDFYYTLGGRHLNDLRYNIENHFSAIVRFFKGQGYVSDLDIFEFPSRSSKYMLNRIRIIRDRIANKETYCDWGETLKCMFPNEEQKDILQILDDIIFAFEYIHDNTEHDDYAFLQAYGYERSEALTAMFGELFGRETKISKETAQADYNQFSSEGGLLDQLRQRKEKGLQLFAKYFETLWE